MGTDAPIHVFVDDRQADVVIDAERWQHLLAAALGDHGVVGPAEVGLAFVPEAEMAELNRHHMGGDGPTDVLAFPIDGADAAPAGQPTMVGDIVICPMVAERAATPLPDEIALLVVHGALHLLGHDHAEPAEAAVMREAEVTLLQTHHRSEAVS